ncbi:MAG: hypothetical protein ACLFQR_09990 [Desulfovibrionales bacterium]
MRRNETAATQVLHTFISAIFSTLPMEKKVWIFFALAAENRKWGIKASLFLVSIGVPPLSTNKSGCDFLIDFPLKFFPALSDMCPKRSEHR